MGRNKHVCGIGCANSGVDAPFFFYVIVICSKLVACLIRQPQTRLVESSRLALGSQLLLYSNPSRVRPIILHLGLLLDLLLHSLQGNAV